MNIDIICTIGPISCSQQDLIKLINSGMTIARLNFSHGDYSDHIQYIQNIKAAEKATGKKIKIMQDLSGPKIRTQNQLPISILKNEELVLGQDLAISHPEILNSLKLQDRILIDDGSIALQIISLNPCTVLSLSNATIKPHKGVNFPDTLLKIDTITEKDKQDLAFGLENQVDLIAQSFVQSAEEIQLLKKLSQNSVPIIAKIERPQAMQNLDAICKAADQIMVARGDLGVELPLYELLLHQNKILETAQKHQKPVIIATQILSSMLVFKTPSRAEVVDASNAILSGASGLLLSNETSVGPFFAEATQVLHDIIQTLK